MQEGVERGYPLRKFGSNVDKIITVQQIIVTIIYSFILLFIQDHLGQKYKINNEEKLRASVLSIVNSFDKYELNFKTTLPISET